MVDEYVIFDTETSGLDPRYNEVLSLSAVKCNAKSGEIIEEFDSLLKPTKDCKFSDEAMLVNGISKSKLQSAPDKIEVYKSFLKFIGDSCPILGYNVGFDKKMITADMARVGLYDVIVEKRFIDILPMVRKKKLPIGRNKLSMVCEHLGYTANFHNSLEDCRATNFVFKTLFLVNYSHPKGM